MYIQNSIQLEGATGKSYTFDLYTKSAKLPEALGIYILVYCHPRGHMAGLKVNILRIGISNNISSTVVDFRHDQAMRERSWNYTGILLIKDKEVGIEYLADLTHTISFLVTTETQHERCCFCCSLPLSRS